MADQFLSEISKQLSLIEQQLGSVNSQMGKLKQGATVSFNAKADRWQGQVEGGKGASFLPNEQLSPINQQAADLVKKRIQDIRQYLVELGKQGHITGANMTEIFGAFSKFGKEKVFGTTDWITQFRELNTVLLESIATIDRLSAVSKSVRTPKATETLKINIDEQARKDMVNSTLTDDLKRKAAEMRAFQHDTPLPTILTPTPATPLSNLNNPEKKLEISKEIAAEIKQQQIFQDSLNKSLKEEEVDLIKLGEQRAKELAQIEAINSANLVKNKEGNIGQQILIQQDLDKEEKKAADNKQRLQNELNQYLTTERSKSLQSDTVIKEQKRIQTELKKSDEDALKLLNDLLKLTSLTSTGKMSSTVPSTGTVTSLPLSPLDKKLNAQQALMNAAFPKQTPEDIAFNDQLRAANQINDAYKNLTPLQRMIVDNQVRMAQTGAQTATQIGRQTKATKELSEAQVQSLRTNPNFQKAFNILDQQAIKGGFDPSKMKVFATTEATTGITHMTASLGELNGVSQKVSLTVDRMGNALVDTQRRFRGFGDAIARDVREFLQWSVAAGLVYGSMQKLQQLVSAMIQQESLLADITITLGKNQSDTNAIFEAASEIADQTGEHITGVLEGYKLAYRATGNISNETERMSTANKLMADSLTLSSLSGMEQSTALDTLSASLKQTGMGLDEGSKLLDKWVRTTQVANVDLQTLATGFAIVGEAADAVGIKADDLNGIIAAIAETGIASATEVGNVTRAIVSGYQSDNAKKAIEGIGIALTDTMGKARSFQDIVSEMNLLRKSGALSDEAFNKVTLAWGGGSRRQAPVAAFIENYQRVGEVSKQSFSAGGQAAEALQIKLDTVQKSVVRLGNAFQTAAQTLGSQNGLLDVINLVLKALTELVKVLGDVQKLSGSAFLPAVGTLATLFLATRGNTGLGALGSRVGLGAGSLITKGLSKIPGMGAKNTGIDLSSYASLRAVVSGNTASSAQSIGEALGPRLSGAAVGMLVNGIMPVLMDKGKDAGTKLAFTAGGTLVGMLGGPQGALIGSAIGSSMGQMYLNFLESKKTTIGGLFTLKLPTPPGETPTLTTEDANKQAEKIGKSVSEWFTQNVSQNVTLPSQTNKAGQQYTVERQYQRYASNASNDELKQLYESTFQGVDYEASKKEKGGGNTEAIAQLLYVLQNYGDVLDEGVKKQAEAYVADLQKLYTITIKLDETKVKEIFKTAVADYQTKYGDLLDQVSQNTAKDITSQLESGDITASAGRNALDAMDTFKEKASQWGVIIRAKFSDMTDAEFNAMVANIMTLTPSENQSDITVYTTAAQVAKNKIDELSKNAYGSDTGNIIPGSNENIQSQINEQQQLVDTNTKIAAQLAQKAYTTNLTNIPQMQRIDTSKLTTGQFPDFFDSMVKNFESRLNEMAGASSTDKLTPEWVKAMMGDSQKVMFDLSDGVAIKDMPAGLVSIWNDLYGETVKQTGIMEQGMGYQLGGFTKSQYESVMPQYKAIRDSILGQGGESVETPQVILTDDGQWMVQQKDWKIIQYLLGQIADNTKKQLEGVYNMPEGASFWFPSSAIPYMQNAADNGINASSLPGLIAAGIGLTSTNTPYEQQIKNPTNPYAPAYVDPGTGSGYGTYYPRSPLAPTGGSGENIVPPLSEQTPLSGTGASKNAPSEEDAKNSLWELLMQIFQQASSQTGTLTKPGEQYRTQNEDMTRMGWKEDVKNFASDIKDLLGMGTGENPGADRGHNYRPIDPGMYKKLPPGYVPPELPGTIPPASTPPPSGAGSSANSASWLQDLMSMMNNQTFTQPENTTNTKLPVLNTKIELSSDIKLNVDGRTIASLILPWLGEYLSNFNGTTSSQTIKAMI